MSSFRRAGQSPGVGLSRNRACTEVKISMTKQSGQAFYWLFTVHDLALCPLPIQSNAARKVSEGAEHPP